MMSMMDAYQRELNDMRNELNSLGRKELQALAKSYGVKANIKSSEIIEELLRVSTSGEQTRKIACSRNFQKATCSRRLIKVFVLQMWYRILMKW